MNKEDLLQQVNSVTNFTDYFALCKDAYLFLQEQPPEKLPEMLVWFFSEAASKYCNPKEGEFEQVVLYSLKYKKLVTGLVDAFSTKGCPESLYYQKLWDCLEVLLHDASPEERAYCLLAILQDERTPYYEMPEGLRMSEEEFGKVRGAILSSIQKLDFILWLPAYRRTEETSRIIHLLENLENREQKSVFLCVLWGRYKERWEKDNANRLGREAEKPRKDTPKSDTEGKDDPFFPKSTEPEEGEGSPVEIIPCPYPALNGDEYDFALFQKGESVYLSDRGKTLAKLNKIFDLHEPDVVKNLKRIVGHYKVMMQGNEFVIYIDKWSGNTNEDENEDLKKAKLTLFSCVSFMLNMKIFYV